MARASRKPPPSRRQPAEFVEPAERAQSAERVVTEAPAPAPTPSSSSTPVKARRLRGQRREEPTRLAADLPPVNLAIRVRKPLDDHLVDLIHALRVMGVRTSKVELIEMLLWELPTGDDSPQVIIERLRAFRTWAPRGTGVLPD